MVCHSPTNPTININSIFSNLIMSIDESISQDPMDHFTRSVVNGKIDWPTYFHGLKPGQKADADQLLHEMTVTSPSQPRTYEVIVQRAGIHPGFALPVIDGETANYNEESEAITLADYLNSIQSDQQKQVITARVQETTE
jgi:hypothetical protein